MKRRALGRYSPLLSGSWSQWEQGKESIYDSIPSFCLQETQRRSITVVKIMCCCTVPCRQVSGTGQDGQLLAWVARLQKGVEAKRHSSLPAITSEVEKICLYYPPKPSNLQTHQLASYQIAMGFAELQPSMQKSSCCTECKQIVRYSEQLYVLPLLLIPMHGANHNGISLLDHVVMWIFCPKNTRYLKVRDEYFYKCSLSLALFWVKGPD